MPKAINDIRYKKYDIRSYLLFLISYFLLHTPSTCFAGGIVLSPAFQEISSIAEGKGSELYTSQANIKVSNKTTTTANINFSLVNIIATDILGRFQFNAPLPQTIHPTDTQIAVITPQSTELKPNEDITIQIDFDSSKLNPGTNSFLLLAHTNTAEPNNQMGSTNLDMYLGATILINSIGGDHIDLKLITDDLSKFPIKFTYPNFITLTVKNEGNTRTVPRGVAAVHDMFGREVMRGAINEKTAIVLPGSQRVIYANLNPAHKTWPITLATIKLNGYDENHQNNFSINRQFLYVNPFVLLIILLIPILKIGTKRLKK